MVAKNNNDVAQRTVLIVRFSALGDVAISIPVIYPLCLAHPHVRFVMLTRKGAAAKLWACRPANLEVVAADVKGEWRGLRGMWRLASRLRRDYGITHVADLHSVMRSWAIDASMLLHGVKVAVINKGRRDKHRLTTGRLRRQLTTSHDRYRQVFAQLGLSCSDNFTSLSQYAPLPLGNLIDGEKPQGERWIAVAPFSQHAGKVYPLPKMLEVVHQLSQLPQVRIFMMGGGQEEISQLREFVQLNPATIKSVAEINHTFADEYGLLSRCDVMVTMDSANMHIASLVGLKCVSVWGATHPWCGFMGWRQPEELAVQVPLKCRPCSTFGNKPCATHDYRCLNSITPQMIVERVLHAIDNNK